MCRRFEAGHSSVVRMHCGQVASEGVNVCYCHSDLLVILCMPGLSTRCYGSWLDADRHAIVS